jgi:hypothetical protein
MPMRSRHCKCEQAAVSTVYKTREGVASDEHKPGDLPKPTTIPIYEDRGGVRWQPVCSLNVHGHC